MAAVPSEIHGSKNTCQFRYRLNKINSQENMEYRYNTNKFLFNSDNYPAKNTNKIDKYNNINTNI